MDTSKEYILMCQKAEEAVQDFAFHKMVAELKPGDFIFEPGRVEWEQIYVYPERKPKELNWDRPIEGFVWLPRQDQLYDVIWQSTCWDCDRPVEIIHDVVDIMYNGKPYDYYDKYFRTLEQLWLAYIMETKYHKRWTGSEWEVF